MNAIFNFDASILLWIQANLRGPLDGLFTFITHLGDKGLLWIVLSLVMLWPRKTRRTGVTSIIAMAIGLVVANLILKNWIASNEAVRLLFFIGSKTDMMTADMI